uniref:Str_synth domain-containing protein n=1 Tax=Panagrellus redivivus TaxID=6233 RepID=A0A7E4UXT9_PANRE
MSTKTVILVAAFAIGYLQLLPNETRELSYPYVEFPNAPKYTGVLAPNKVLESAEILFKGQLEGPESIVIEGDTQYVAVINEVVQITKDKIVKRIPVTKTKNCDKNITPACGRPLGLRRLDKTRLIVADGILGLITVDTETSKVEVLLPAETIVEGHPVRYVDDLDLVDKDTVIFSDATWICNSVNTSSCIVPALPTGRIYKFHIPSKSVSLLADNLYFANGVQLHPSKDSVLFTETVRARAYRYYLTGPRQGVKEIFHENLPVHPDNLRASSDGKYIYIAGATARVPEKFDFIQLLFANPTIRWVLHTFVPSTTLDKLASPAEYGIALKLDLNGKIVASYHAPKGPVNRISQLSDDGKTLYICSYENDFLARIPLPK